MIRCGELCKSCVVKCREIVTPEQSAEIECPVCDGDGCEECVDGWFTVSECPARFIGSELIQDIQVISSSEHHLPVAGGILDQSAWWFELKETLRREERRVQEDQQRRQA